jgi:HEXXH motif-containing protein
LLTIHRLSEEAFTALANGDGDRAVVRQLREAQHSKHVMLLHVVARAAEDADLASPAVVAFRAGYKLLAKVQAADPDTVAWLLSLPHIGGWAHECLSRLNEGQSPDFGYLACAAASAAVRAGVRFEADVPVRNGRVLLPGLGFIHGIGEDPWVRLHSDGERLIVGASISARCADLVPDDGSGELVPHWRGTAMVRAVAEGQTWEVQLETADRHLDRYMLPMSVALTPEEVAGWHHCIQSAWEVLVRHHGWVAGPIAEGVSVIVPMTRRSDADLDSATTPAAFGAIAASLPPGPIIMAEILVHEFQHLKLCGVMDLMPLIEPCDERVYAPWRPDPRPAGGLLQGVYAHLGVARFWDVQRRVETEPDDLFRAQVMYEHWRPTIELCTSTLLKAGCLTVAGTRFVEMLRDRGRGLEPETVPAEAREIAAEAARDHWLTWQLRHMATDPDLVVDLAAAYRDGEPFHGQALPEFRVEEDTRKVDSTVRSRLLEMRYLDPRRYRELCTTDMPGISAADGLLFQRMADAAVEAYRDEISVALDPQPGSWIGLALAVCRLAPMPLREIFDTRLPFIFDVYTWLRGHGIQRDPLDVAAWFT